MNGAMMQAMQRQMGGGRGGPPAANTASSDKVESKLLAPGVTYLGKGSAKELMAKADKAGIDYVVVFKVDITVGPKDKVSNSTRVRILPASRPAKGSELKEIYAGKSMLYRLAAEIDAGLDRKVVHARASALKLFCSEMAGRVVDKAVQILGGRGYMREQAVERLYRDVRVDRIWEGTSEIQRVVIGGQIRKRGLDVYTGW